MILTCLLLGRLSQANCTVHEFMSSLGSFADVECPRRLHKCQNVPWSFDDDMAIIFQMICNLDIIYIDTCTHTLLYMCTQLFHLSLPPHISPLTPTPRNVHQQCIVNLYKICTQPFRKHISVCQSSYCGPTSWRRSLGKSPSIIWRCAPTWHSQVSWSPPDSILRGGLLSLPK